MTPSQYDDSERNTMPYGLPGEYKTAMLKLLQELDASRRELYNLYYKTLLKDQTLACYEDLATLPLIPKEELIKDEYKPTQLMILRTYNCALLLYWVLQDLSTQQPIDIVKILGHYLGRYVLQAAANVSKHAAKAFANGCINVGKKLASLASSKEEAAAASDPENTTPTCDMQEDYNKTTQRSKSTTKIDALLWHFKLLDPTGWSLPNPDDSMSLATCKTFLNFLNVLDSEALQNDPTGNNLFFFFKTTASLNGTKDNQPVNKLYDANIKPMITVLKTRIQQHELSVFDLFAKSMPDYHTNIESKFHTFKMLHGEFSELDLKIEKFQEKFQSMTSTFQRLQPLLEGYISICEQQIDTFEHIMQQPIMEVLVNKKGNFTGFQEIPHNDPSLEKYKENLKKFQVEQKFFADTLADLTKQYGTAKKKFEAEIERLIDEINKKIKQFESNTTNSEGALEKAIQFITDRIEKATTIKEIEAIVQYYEGDPATIIPLDIETEIALYLNRLPEAERSTITTHLKLLQEKHTQTINGLHEKIHSIIQDKMQKLSIQIHIKILNSKLIQQQATASKCAELFGLIQKITLDYAALEKLVLNDYTWLQALQPQQKLTETLPVFITRLEETLTNNQQILKIWQQHIPQLQEIQDSIHSALQTRSAEHIDIALNMLQKSTTIPSTEKENLTAILQKYSDAKHWTGQGFHTWYNLAPTEDREIVTAVFDELISNRISALRQQIENEHALLEKIETHHSELTQYHAELKQLSGTTISDDAEHQHYQEVIQQNVTCYQAAINIARSIHSLNEFMLSQETSHLHADMLVIQAQLFNQKKIELTTLKEDFNKLQGDISEHFKQNTVESLEKMNTTIPELFTAFENKKEAWKTEVLDLMTTQLSQFEKEKDRIQKIGEKKQRGDITLAEVRDNLRDANALYTQLKKLKYELCNGLGGTMHELLEPLNKIASDANSLEIIVCNMLTELNVLERGNKKFESEHTIKDQSFKIKDGGIYQHIILDKIEICASAVHMTTNQNNNPSSRIGADFSNALLKNCNFSHNIIRAQPYFNFKFNGADLRETTFDEKDSLCGIQIDQHTQLSVKLCQRILSDNITALSSTQGYLDTLLDSVTKMPMNEKNNPDTAITAQFILDILQKISSANPVNPTMTKTEQTKLLQAKKQRAIFVTQQLVPHLSSQEALKLGDTLAHTKHDGKKNPYAYIRQEQQHGRCAYGNTKTWETIINEVKKQLRATITDTDTLEPTTLEPTQYKQYYNTMKTHAKHDYGFGLFPCRKPLEAKTLIAPERQRQQWQQRATTTQAPITQPIQEGQPNNSPGFSSTTV